MSEYDSDIRITHGRSSEDESDFFFILEYDSDNQQQVANGTMVDNITDELSQHASAGHK